MYSKYLEKKIPYRSTAQSLVYSVYISILVLSTSDQNIKIIFEVNMLNSCILILFIFGLSSIF